MIEHGAKYKDIKTSMGFAAVHCAVLVCSAGNVEYHVQGGDPDCVSLLVKRKADLGAKDSFGRTPLDIAKIENRYVPITISVLTADAK